MPRNLHFSAMCHGHSNAANPRITKPELHHAGANSWHTQHRIEQAHPTMSKLQPPPPPRAAAAAAAAPQIAAATPAICLPLHLLTCY